MQEKSQWVVRGYLNSRELRRGMDTSTQGIFEAEDIEEATRLAQDQGYQGIDFVKKMQQ